MINSFKKYPPWAWWVMGGQIVSELTMNSPWACQVNTPSPPVPIPQHCSIPDEHHQTAPTSLLFHVLPVVDSHRQDVIENHVPLYTTHPDDSVRMSGDGESEEGIVVVPLIQFVSVPANSLRALHKSAKRRHWGQRGYYPGSKF